MVSASASSYATSYLQPSTNSAPANDTTRCVTRADECKPPSLPPGRLSRFEACVKCGIPAGDGEHHWLLGVLATIKAGVQETGGSMTIAEFEAPPGWAVPPHRHLDQDEMFYVLDGEVTFWCDGEESTFTGGGMAWLPRQKAHLFHVSEAGPARLFNIHTGSTFERLVHAMGEPAPEARIPDPTTDEQT